MFSPSADKITAVFDTLLSHERETVVPPHVHDPVGTVPYAVFQIKQQQLQIDTLTKQCVELTKQLNSITHLIATSK